jgi:molybdopterin molybdotransferase
MLTVSQALDLILESSQVLPSQTVVLQDSFSQVLAESLTTPHDSPPFDKSMMDGFTVDSRTVFDGGTNELKVVETITAGTLPTQTPGSGTATRIMTGAPLPPNADCVIAIEDTQFNEQQPDLVTIPTQSVQAERHVLRQGASAKTGSALLPAGTRIKPQHIAVLAEFGISNLATIPQASVGVLATGDELVPSNEELTPGLIRNSNEPMLEAQIRRAGATAVPLGIARDNEAELSSRIAVGLEQDVLLLSGGVSAGTLDLVPAQLAAAGVKQVFHKVQLKPGKPLWFGILQREQHRCLVFGLPGNPVSSMVCFEVFVRPTLDILAGRLPHGSRNQTATLTQDITIRGNRPTYFPSALVRTETGLVATPVAWGGSADLRSTAWADGVCCLEPGGDGFAAGASVPVICWDDV